VVEISSGKGASEAGEVGPLAIFLGQFGQNWGKVGQLGKIWVNLVRIG